LAGGTSEGGPPSVVVPPPSYIIYFHILNFWLLQNAGPYWWDSCRPTSLTGGPKCLTGGPIVPPVKQFKYALRHFLKSSNDCGLFTKLGFTHLQLQVLWCLCSMGLFQFLIIWTYRFVISTTLLTTTLKIILQYQLLYRMMKWWI